MNRIKAIKRLFNKYLNDIQAYLLRNSYIIGYPTRICIEPTNYCQLHCPLCPTGENKIEVSKGMMSFVQFKQLLDEIGDYIYKITLYNWGEPLLNPELPKFVKYATNRGIRINISTNLNYYTDDMLEELVQNGLYKLTIGLDGASQNVYEQYRVGGNFNKVLEGINKINEYKKKYNTQYPILVWQYILLKSNEEEQYAAEQMAKQLNMQFRIKAVSLNEQQKQLIEKWYPKNKRYQKATYNAEHKNPYIDRCLELWNSPVINWNGELVPCSCVYGNTYSVGNVFAEGFKKTWNNAEMRKARKYVMNKKVSGTCVCSECTQLKTKRSGVEFFKAIKRKGSARRGIDREKKENEYKKWNVYNGRNGMV